MRGGPKRFVFMFALALMSSLTVSRAALADDKADCIAAFEQAQSLRADGKITKSIEQFTTCARDVCPASMRKECIAGAERARASQSSIVVAAKDPLGQELFDVKVTIDGAVVATTLDGKATLLDPGVHQARLERPGSVAVDRQFVAREGQKNQLLTVELLPAVVPTAPTGTPVEQPPAPPAARLGKLRVIATCGDDPNPVAARRGLVVEEIGDEKDIALEPTSDPQPRLRYDDASRSRVLADPDFVEYQLPPGTHRIRVKSERCKPLEGKYELLADQTVEVRPKLEWLVPPEVLAKERETAAREERASRASGWRMIGYVVGGIGVASGVAMAGFMVAGNDASNQIKSGTVSTYRDNAQSDINSKIVLDNQLAAAFGIGAAVCIGVGVPLVLFNLPPAAPTLSVTPLPGGGRLTASMWLP